MKRKRISVAMAVYNGEKYLRDQIDSILFQLSDSDELIISYNKSNDSTLEIIKEYEKKDSRIKKYISPKLGVLKNFENAIRHCNNEIIFLADQDDVWLKNKLEVMLKYFKNDMVGAVSHKSILVDESLEPIRDFQKCKTIYATPLSILYQNKIQGSCLAFRKKYVKYILPFPESIPMHDSWIGIVISKFAKVEIIGDGLILYRQHIGQVTSRKHKSIKMMLIDRFKLFYLYKNRIRNIRHNSRL